MILIDLWPHGQAVKTSPSHGGFSGSNPDGVTIYCLYNIIVRKTSFEGEPSCSRLVVFIDYLLMINLEISKKYIQFK